MKALKRLYMFLRNHMPNVAVLMVLSLVPVAIWPVLGWVAGGCMAILCLVLWIGDYPKNWIAEVEIPDCPGY